MPSKIRDIADILGVTEAANPTNAVLTSTADGSGGVTVYATKEDLPSSGLTSGDQAYVTANSRFYISNGSGWYNVALINATPSLSIDPTGTINLSKTGETTTITLTGTDSDNAVAGLTYSVESDGSFGGLATLSQDSSVFTITPLGDDSATTVQSTLTFKASDGISFGSGQRTFTLSFKTVNSNYTTLLAKADTASTDNQVDASTNNHTITEYGNVTSTAFSPYHPKKYSMEFDGLQTTNTQAYIAIPNTTSMRFGTGDWTGEVWAYCYPPTAASESYCLFQQRVEDEGSGNNFGWSFYVTVTSSSSTLNLYRRGRTNPAVSLSTHVVNKWTHFAIVRNSGTTYLYADGTEVYSATDDYDYDQAFAIRSDTRTMIGQIETELPGAYFKGLMSELRFVKGTAVYTSAFTPPIDPLTEISGTSLFLFSGVPYVQDVSTNNQTIQRSDTGSPNYHTNMIAKSRYDHFAYAKVLHGGSVYFDGTGDYLEIPHDNSLDLGNNNFTIEWWMNPQSVAGSSVALFDKGSSSIAPITYSPILIWTNTQYYTCYVSSNGSSWDIINNLNTGWAKWKTQWKHCAIVRNGSQIAFFLNGVLTATSTAAGSSTLYDSTRPITINARYNGASEHDDNYISDFRWLVGSAVYDASGASIGQRVFTPPTEPLTAVANTKLLTCTNKNDIWDEGSGSLLTKINNVGASNTQRKFLTSSAMFFDGVDDSLEINADVANFGTGDFTIEMWIYPVEYGNGLFNKTTETGSSSPPSVSVYMTSTQFLIGVNSGSATGSWVTTSSTAALNQWSHFAITREGTSLRAFLNGNSIHVSTNSANVDNNITFNLGKWRNSTEHFNGYMQDVRLTKGLARYTANFTPPTSEFDG